MIGELLLTTHWSPRDLEAIDDADLDFWIAALNEGTAARDAREKLSG